MAHGDIKFDPSHGDFFPYPAPNCEKTKHNLKKFSVHHHLTACLFRTCHKLFQKQA
jgi:hypothetical protein